MSIVSSTALRLLLSLGASGSFATMPLAAAASGSLPDGRTVTPVGFTIPVESFASSAVLSPDGKWLAVLCQGSGAVDILDSRESVLVDRLPIASATGFAWTTDGLYVTGGYTGEVARYTYDGAASKAGPVLVKRASLSLGPGLLNGIAEDPLSHRIAVARTAKREVVLLDEPDGGNKITRMASGQPFAVAFSNGVLFATLYDGDHIDAWGVGMERPKAIATGAHPTAILPDGDRAFVADADGHDVVAIDTRSLAVVRRYDLASAPGAPPGQTPSGMALSDDGETLFVSESGDNDVAAVNLANGKVAGRIPTGWYPMSVVYANRSTVGKKDTRKKAQLWITSAQGMGAQPDPAGEWNGTYTGLVQHLVFEPANLPAWSSQVAKNDAPNSPPFVRAGLPPIEHVVFIVRENKQFDEEFGDEAQAEADPALLLYGRKYTPNAHALAERYTLFDNFMGDGEASIYGHAWTTQGMVNDYHERNAHSRSDSTDIDARVAWSIWPDPVAGDDTLAPSVMDADWYHDLDDLPQGPRVNASGVFGPRGELIDELARRNVSFRVFGEQMTVAPSGKIVAGLAEHAARAYPGAHIDFDVLDTMRAQIFISDLKAHGLARYSYLTLPTDHTAGTKPGFYTPAAFVSNNDLALGQIVAAISQRPEWERTLIFVTTDDPQGTGDHVDSHRMPAFAIGPYVRRGYVAHARYSIPSVLRTVEVLFGLQPLTIYDARATPIFDALAREPSVDRYAALPAEIPLQRNPGAAAANESVQLDGPASVLFPAQEWASIKGGTPPPAALTAAALPWRRLEAGATR